MKAESIESRGYSSPSKWTWNGDVDFADGFKISNNAEGHSEITFDYGRAEGGLPFIGIAEVASNGPSVELDIIFSETYEGVQSGTGDGPFFLFSNAMNTYRVNTQYFEPSTTPSLVRLRFAQRSQRYQKIVLKSPNSSLTISHLGFTHVRPPNLTKSTFECSNEKINRIWRDGVRTVDMCTVEASETAETWEVTENGTRIRGQHWAPCRRGTRWGDKIVLFEVQIERGGASWGVHMVANGLIFCLDINKRTLGAFEGLSETKGVFPSIPRGKWDISADMLLDDWIFVKTIAKGSSLSVQLNGTEVATVVDLDIHPILGGSRNNTGSVAFGGPEEYKAVYRSLHVTDLEGKTLYQNNLLLQDQARTCADFAVGTNPLACTIDGAKRDRALFGGDLFVMGRSMYYSTANLNAALGSIKLLTSHQTEDGYLGNLCPIQAPMHDESVEPPTYAFYSLSYALLLVVAIKDYWLHSGDVTTIQSIWERMEKLIAFTERFVDERGLVVAPPPLSMDWFPMGGPIFGASGKINLAYFDALKAMAKMCICTKLKDGYSARAERLRTSIVAHLWNTDFGIMRMSDTSPTGICQDINAYGITTGASPLRPNAESVLAAPQDASLPLAFQGIERWDEKKVVSPYASGFAVEALFERNHGSTAVDLIERVWGIMADPTNANYSGGHWEAMKPDGTPFHDDTSLMHGWSTWPVYLLPRYLAGLEPIEPGWSRWKCRPILAGLRSVQVDLSTPAGEIKISLRVEESQGAGEIMLTIPSESVAEVVAPEGWVIVTSDEIDDARVFGTQLFVGKGDNVLVRIIKAHENTVKNNARTSDKDHLVTTTEEIKKLPMGGLSSLDKQRIWVKPSKFLNRVIRWIF